LLLLQIALVVWRCSSKYTLSQPHSTHSSRIPSTTSGASSAPTGASSTSTGTSTERQPDPQHPGLETTS
jgi:hypothetical protein